MGEVAGYESKVFFLFFCGGGIYHTLALHFSLFTYVMEKEVYPASNGRLWLLG